MSAAQQLELPAAPHARTPLFKVAPDHPNVGWLLTILREHGWQTRRQIAARAREAGLKMSAAYSERWVRALVEAAGADVVKCQSGFNLRANCTAEEKKRAAEQSISQGKKMVRYGIALLRASHKDLQP